MAITIEEIRRLYVEEDLTLQQVGDRVGITRQAVQQRLRGAGIMRRPTGHRYGPRAHEIAKQSLDLDLLIRQYVEEKQGINRLAKIYGLSFELLRRVLVTEGVEIRDGAAARTRKYPEIYDLGPGESVVIVMNSKNPHSSVQRVATGTKRRFSVAKISKNTYRVTRIT